MARIIVTAIEEFTDIDGLACNLGYAHLLKLLGKNAVSLIPGSLNHSVTPFFRKFPMDYVTTLAIKPDDRFVLVDLSVPKDIPAYVIESKVIKVYDHRFGYEDYWKIKLGANAKIEAVGSCATIITEQYMLAKKKPSTSDAALLSAAIVSNTLNFTASVTTDRDKNAFNKLSKIVDLPVSWIETYFMDQETTIFSNPIEAVKQDTKPFVDNDLPYGMVIGQLELWNSKAFIEQHLKEIQEAMTSFGLDLWFFTSPSISEGKNYIFSQSPKIKKLLENNIGAIFKGDLGTTSKLYLRKEILKKIREIKN